MGPRSDDIPSLLADLESFRVERTRSLSDTEKHARAICAFANDMPGSQQPGYLFIGVDDAGRPAGAMIDDDLLQQLAAHRHNGNILPQPDMSVSTADINGGRIAVVRVMPSSMPPVRYKGVV